MCNPLKGVTEVCFTAGVLTKAVTARISLGLRRQEAAIFSTDGHPPSLPKGVILQILEKLRYFKEFYTSLNCS